MTVQYGATRALAAVPYLFCRGFYIFENSPPTFSSYIWRAGPWTKVSMPDLTYPTSYNGPRIMAVTLLLAQSNRSPYESDESQGCANGSRYVLACAARNSAMNPSRSSARRRTKCAGAADPEVYVKLQRMSSISTGSKSRAFSVGV